MVMVEKAIMRSAVTEETNTAATQRPAELGDVHNTKLNSQQEGGRILRRASYQAHILHNSGSCIRRNCISTGNKCQFIGRA